MINSNKIYLTGMMGAGKTTVGFALAECLTFHFIDLDTEIENTIGLSVSDIFKNHGENFFREREKDILNKISQLDNKVIISCGGGTPCFFNNIELINATGTSVYLYASPKTLLNRILNSDVKRPLIHADSNIERLDKIQNLLNERDSFYRKCNLIIDTDLLKPIDITKIVVDYFSRNSNYEE